MLMIPLRLYVLGMANERLFLKRGDEGYIPFAYAGYSSTIDLHESLRGGKSANALRGLSADEVERWGEVALYRNALLSVRHGNMTQALNSLRAYQAHAGRWPSNFRETQRIVIARTYLRLLNQSVEKGGYTPPPSNVVASRDDCRSAAYQTSVIAASASRAVIRDFESERASRHFQSNNGKMTSNRLGQNGGGGTTTTTTVPSFRTTSTRRPTDFRGRLIPQTVLWSNEFLTVKKAAADTIAKSSHFPHAGQINIPALELADDVVRGWQLNGEKGGDWADEVVEVLYLLSRVTFHSQRVTRHLFTLLVASENYEEAKRALDLYIQIVDKAREGDAAEAGGLVEESRRQEQGYEGPANGNGALTEESKKEAEKLHLDSDSDELYVNTLLYGVHVYIKYLQDAQSANTLARKVIDFVASDPKQTLAKDFELWAKIKRLGGIARAAFCATENNVTTRATLQDESLSLLKQSITLDDQSSETYYALAYLQSEMLNVNHALRSARRAVELEPANVEYWHLLTLLLTSQKDYKGALQIAEEGLAEAEDDDEADQQKGGTAATTTAKPLPSLPNGNTNGVTLMNKSSSSSSASSSLRTTLLSVDFPPRGSERSQSILRLMMTHNALEEIVEGGQAAIEGQREIFEFFHRRVGFNVQSHGPTHRIGVPTMNGNGTYSSNDDASLLPTTNNKTSTQLGGATRPHSRFHSLTGFGQSGSRHHLLPLHSTANPFHRGDESHQAALHVGAPPLAAASEIEQEQIQTTTNAQIRNLLHEKQQGTLLAALWLMSAATFRRNGKLTESRVSIQEAERVDPGEAEVWVQLALWFEQQPPQHGEQPATNLSLQCLYKALACKGDHVAATIHLARLYLENPSNPSIRDVQQAIADTASPLPQTSDHISPSPLASDLLSHTQSRRITASSASPNDSKESKDGKDSNTSTTLPPGTESNVTKERRRLATISLAEGLLVNLTQTNGWNVSEAWLFLSRVMKETNRWEKQRECLEYALQLEKAKTIRALPNAVYRL